MAAHCHKQVAEIARRIAGELYEKLMGDNQFWEVWQEQNPGASRKEMERRFIDRNWGGCLGEARKALVMVLKDPSVSEAIKMEIVDVLEKDASLMRGRGRVIN